MRPNQLARLIGIVYLIQTFVGSFPLYVRSKLIVDGNAEQTAENILNAEGLFRYGLLSEVGVSITWFFIGYFSYCLFCKRQPQLAALLLAMVIVGIAALTSNAIHLASAYDLLAGVVHAPALDAGQVHSLAMLILNMFSRGEAAWALWAGLWLIPLGLAVLYSDGVPKIFGPLLIIASLGYVLPIVASFILPNFAEPLRWLIIYSGLTELSWGLWLLIKGVNQKVLQGTHPKQ